MSIAWENNPNGICEDAPACGCCGPQGDGRYYPDEPPDIDDWYDSGYDGPEDDEDEGDYSEPSPDPNWMSA